MMRPKAAAFIATGIFILTGCTEPNYRNEVTMNSQGGGYTIKRVPKAPEEMRPMIPAPLPKTPADQAAETAEITRVETAFANALKAGDSAALGKLLSPDFVQTGLTGNTTTGPQFLDDVRNKSLTVDSATLSDLKISLHDNTAVATGKLTLSAKLRGADISGDYRFTDTLQGKDGKWQKIASQMAR